MPNRTVFRLPLPATFRRRILLLFLLVVELCCSMQLGAPAQAAETFPTYPCIRGNVQFWEDVYGRYGTNQGVLHDREQVQRIYTVVGLVSRDFPGATVINEMRIATAKDQIAKILTRLGSGQAPRTAGERRIAALFGKRATRQHYLDAIERIRLQVGQKDRFYAGVLRSGRYMAHYKQIFVSHGLPADLAYLPHVESSFLIKAHSKVGAAGLWQFTRGTGKEYMIVNDLVDERYDPYIAAHSAAKLLKTNYNALQSWPLAVTAYNCGRGGMLKAVRERGNYENIFRSYTGGSFGFASRNFYSEFLAARRVASRLLADPKMRSQLEKPEATVTMRLKEATHVSRLRQVHSISHQDFIRLNPALLAPVTSGKKPVPKNTLVRLPANTQMKKSYTVGTSDPAIEHANKETALLRSASPRLAAANSRPPAAEVMHNYYTVRRGDTVFAIARQFNISSGELLAANAKSSNHQIQVGERLRIPGQQPTPRKKVPQIKHRMQ